MEVVDRTEVEILRSPPATSGVVAGVEITVWLGVWLLDGVVDGGSTEAFGGELGVWWSC